MDTFIVTSKGKGPHGDWIQAMDSNNVVWTFWRKLKKASAKPQKINNRTFKPHVLTFKQFAATRALDPNFLWSSKES